MTKVITGVLATLCSAILLAACGSGDDSTSSTTHDMGAMSPSMSMSAAAPGEIVISGNMFSVPTSVRHGGFITVRNKDTVEHSVTADNGTFNVEVEPGETTTFTAPAEPAAYAFHCTYHPTMRATLTVN